MFKAGFDNDKYIRMQSQKIRERIDKFGGKLYLEFGGKVFDDYHASRVLPGFEPDSKIRMLLQLKEQAEIVFAINADDIEKNKIRGDLGITYDMDVLRLIDTFTGIGLFVGSVVITQFREQPAAIAFEKKLRSLGIRSYRHYSIPDYPANINLIISDDGFGKNDYIETERSLIVVTAPGPGSGKMATCLSQIYHDFKRGVSSGYAKFETFPVWNLPLKHPVNLAYEAATADLNDVNMIDPFHLEAYNEKSVNYNRDIEIFPVLNTMFQQILGESPYKSPTDMGVNMAGFCIFDNEAVCEASKQEIIRRYYNTMCAVKQGNAEQSEVYKIELIMNQLGLKKENRPTVTPALLKSETNGGMPAMAMELPDGRIVTGKTSSFLGAAAAVLLNALKAMGGIDKKALLISPEIIEPVQDLKVNYMGNKNPRLHTDEVLIALSIAGATDETAKCAVRQLKKLRGCQAHSTVILSKTDEQVFQKLGINLTYEPKYQTNRLYRK